MGQGVNVHRATFRGPHENRYLFPPIGRHMACGKESTLIQNLVINKPYMPFAAGLLVMEYLMS